MSDYPLLDIAGLGVLAGIGLYYVSRGSGEEVVKICKNENMGKRCNNITINGNNVEINSNGNSECCLVSTYYRSETDFLSGSMMATGSILGLLPAMTNYEQSGGKSVFLPFGIFATSSYVAYRIIRKLNK